MFNKVLEFGYSCFNKRIRLRAAASCDCIHCSSDVEKKVSPDRDSVSQVTVIVKRPEGLELEPRQLLA